MKGLTENWLDGEKQAFHEPWFILLLPVIWRQMEKNTKVISKEIRNAGAEY